jgi:hypothetical protein
MVTYLVNAFSLNMVNTDKLYMTIDRVDADKFCSELRERVNSGELQNAIGHDSTMAIVNSLCGVNMNVNRVSVKANDNDQLLIIMIGERLQEGKVLNESEIKEMMNKGKVNFYIANIRYNVNQSFPDCEGE